MPLRLVLRTKISKLTAVATAAALAMAPLPAFAQQEQGPKVLRDTESEQLLRDYTRPVLRAAGLEKQNIQVVIINDRAFNAFVADGHRIFVNYGALMQSETPNQIIGVLAHETGHLAGGHLAKMHEQLARAQTQMIIAMLLGAGAMAVGARGGNSDNGLVNAGAAAVSAPQEIIRRSLLSYQRQQEENADRAAVKFLNATGQSAKGMYETFRRFTNDSLFAAHGADPYVQSHPMPAERVAALEQMARTSPYWDKKDDPALQMRHDMMRAKISAFMERQDTVYRRYPPVRHQHAGALRARDLDLSAWQSAQRAGADRRTGRGPARQPVFLRIARPGAAGRRQAGGGDRAVAQGGSALESCALIEMLLGQALVAPIIRPIARKRSRSCGRR